jgi:hypothetical protein
VDINIREKNGTEQLIQVKPLTADEISQDWFV